MKDKIKDFIWKFSNKIQRVNDRMENVLKEKRMGFLVKWPTWLRLAFI